MSNDIDIQSLEQAVSELTLQEGGNTQIQAILRCIETMGHARQCHDANCCMLDCKKMKRVFAHTRSCQQKSIGGCAICKQFISLCVYHAKHCQDGATCPVPLCLKINQKLSELQMQARL